MDIAMKLEQAGQLKAKMQQQIQMLDAKKGQMVVEVCKLDGEIRVLTEIQMEEAEILAKKKAEDNVEKDSTEASTQGKGNKSQKQAEKAQK